MFFLNEEVETQETLTTNEEFYCEDVTGLMEMSLDAEISWNNITMNAIQGEYNAVVNESTVLLEEAQGNWFQSVLKWLQDQYQKLSELVQRVIGNIVKFFDMAGKYATKNEKAILAANSVEVKINDWKKVTSVAQGLYKVEKTADEVVNKFKTSGNTANTVASVDDICKEFFKCEFKDFSKELLKTVRGAEKTSKQLSAGEIRNYHHVCKNALSNTGSMKTTFNAMAKSLKDMMAETKKMASEAGKEGKSEEAKAFKNAVSSFKNALTVVNKAKSTSISLNHQLVSDGLKVCKAAVAASKGFDKPDYKSDVKQIPAPKQESASAFLDELFGE